MPIIKIDTSTQLEFGHGDIFVAPGLLKTDGSIKIGSVVFKNQEKRAIGEYIKHDPELELELSKTPCRMIFKKIESIDVVIDALEKAKRMMIQGTTKIDDGQSTIDIMRDLVNIQGEKGNYDQDEYMLGMYNGMELMLATAEDRNPIYKRSNEQDVNN